MFNRSMSLFPLYFEGETPTEDAAAAAAAAAAKPTATFTQEDLNKFLADDRRKHQEKYKALEGTYQSLLGTQQLATGDRQKLEQELQDLQASFRTKEQQLEFEKKQASQKYETELSATKKLADQWQTMYREERIDRALLDASGSDAFNPSQIVNLLRPATELKDELGADGKPTGKLVPMVQFSDIDEKTGEPIQTLRTPADAVKRMKELPAQYGNLFRSNVVSGVGAGNASTVGSGGQKVDVSRLTPEQYRKLRKENPELLGLRPRS